MNLDSHHSRDTQAFAAVQPQADSALIALSPADPINGRHVSSDAQEPLATVGDDQGPGEAQFIHVIAEIQELWRQRVGLHKAEKSLTLQIKALARRFVGGSIKEADALYKATIKSKGTDVQTAGLWTMAEPFMAAREIIKFKRKEHEKRLAMLVKKLPIWPWANDVRGFSAITLASLVGEAGDLGKYRTVSCLWKRFGLAVIDGERQRKKTGDAGIVHGYCPRRRSVVWSVGACLIRSRNEQYREIYLAIKAKKRPLVDCDGHAHNHAKRLMEKEFLKHFWIAWKAA